MSFDYRELSKRIEAHNPSRKGHGERVSSYAVATGYELGIRGSELVELRWAALVHDVWKLALPVQLLEKPGSLDEHEMNRVREAAQIISDTDPQIRAILKDQYANYNKGANLLSRIVFVCTVFDVMSTHQPWRAAMVEHSALIELKANSGRQFDPAVTKAFLKGQPLIQPLHT